MGEIHPSRTSIGLGRATAFPDSLRKLAASRPSAVPRHHAPAQLGRSNLEHSRETDAAPGGPGAAGALPPGVTWRPEVLGAAGPGQHLDLVAHGRQRGATPTAPGGGGDGRVCAIPTQVRSWPSNTYLSIRPQPCRGRQPRPRPLRGPARATIAAGECGRVLPIVSAGLCWSLLVSAGLCWSLLVSAGLCRSPLSPLSLLSLLSPLSLLSLLVSAGLCCLCPAMPIQTTPESPPRELFDLSSKNSSPHPVRP